MRTIRRLSLAVSPCFPISAGHLPNWLGPDGCCCMGFPDFHWRSLPRNVWQPPISHPLPQANFLPGQEAACFANLGNYCLNLSARSCYIEMIKKLPEVRVKRWDGSCAAVPGALDAAATSGCCCDRLSEAAERCQLLVVACRFLTCTSCCSGRRAGKGIGALSAAAHVTRGLSHPVLSALTWCLGSRRKGR